MCFIFRMDDLKNKLKLSFATFQLFESFVNENPKVICQSHLKEKISEISQASERLLQKVSFNIGSLLHKECLVDIKEEDPSLDTTCAYIQPSPILTSTPQSSPTPQETQGVVYCSTSTQKTPVVETVERSNTLPNKAFTPHVELERYCLEWLMIPLPIALFVVCVWVGP